MANFPDFERSRTFDILVIGSGAAGLYATLCLPPNLRIGLISKARLKTGASRWAQGGIAAAIDPQDSPKLHLEDTLKAGAGLCDRQSVQFLVDHAAKAIDHLLTLGVTFDRKGENLALTLEAAHSRPRVLHAADTTGKAIVDTLIAQVLQRPNIQVISPAAALALKIHPQTGTCRGVTALHYHQMIELRAGAVILATGGGGQVFAQTTNPSISTGDGVAMAWRAGAIVRDLEFFQFHPTALTQPDAPRFLISEAVRGEGAHLVDETGYRFAFDYHPQGELAPRDIVSRAIFSHLQRTNLNPAQAHVYLDLQPIEPERIQYRFPNIIQMCSRWGVDVLTQPIPVAPAAHYWMGGIATDLTSQTSIPGLYAVGEVANTGVHGANRLASNSLLECLVFATQLAEIQLERIPEEVPPSPIWVREDWGPDMKTVNSIRQELPVLMWQSAGICRTQATLDQAITQVRIWRQEIKTSPLNQYVEPPSNSSSDPSLNPWIKFECPEAESQLQLYAETLNLLDIAWLILNSAAWRTESRGGHYRSDYPETQSDWQIHTLVQGDRWWKSSKL
ncbi:MAG: L-aspartate oxidase [Oscillatoriales cyanobacterium RM2_1_1]|nr:L-aspartate oxidase [Oscillatoriales cyanobacterium SM2_3_0]NJO44661.1 L-aspartate oxidase [Oscillatoriales cyanobacterium RM2_1_1]